MPIAGDIYKVSIILPTYNRADIIAQSIDSIVCQTYQNWELLVIDDVSTDNTEETVRSRKDDRVLYYRTPQRLGIAGSRNFGMKKVNGDFIAFIDSDDLWAQTKLEKQIAAMQEYPEAGFGLTGGFNFRNDLEPVDYYYKQRDGMKYGELLTDFFRSEISGTTSSLLFRKRCVDTVGLFNEKKRFPEVDLILRLSKYFKGIVLYEPLLYRRLHASNASAAEWKLGYEEGIGLIAEYKNNLPRPILRNALFRLHMNYGEDCILHHMKFLAIKNFLSAWKNKPFSIVPVKKIGKALLRT